MPYPILHKIQLSGRTYVDLQELEKHVQDIYPLKTHSLRRLARMKKIPSKRIGMARKDWFNLSDVKQALNVIMNDANGLKPQDDLEGL